MQLLYANDLVVIAETEDNLIKRFHEWKDFVKNRCMRVNINKTKVTISGEWQKVMQEAARWQSINQSIKVICNTRNVVHKLASEARAVASGRVLMVIENVGLEASFESV